MYDGVNLCLRGDVVVVTVNHRLNAFGYLHLGDIGGEQYAASGNAGMLDIVQALEWVRDNIDAGDLAAACWQYFRNPRPGAVYNIGGGRETSCSVLEAISLIEDVSGRTIESTYDATHRRGDHIWWISDVRRFRADYPDWSPAQTLRGTVESIHSAMLERSVNDGPAG